MRLSQLQGPQCGGFQMFHRPVLRWAHAGAKRSLQNLEDIPVGHADNPIQLRIGDSGTIATFRSSRILLLLRVTCLRDKPLVPLQDASRCSIRDAPHRFHAPHRVAGIFGIVLPDVVVVRVAPAVPVSESAFPEACVDDDGTGIEGDVVVVVVAAVAALLTVVRVNSVRGDLCCFFGTQEVGSHDCNPPQATVGVGLLPARIEKIPDQLISCLLGLFLAFLRETILVTRYIWIGRNQTGHIGERLAVSEGKEAVPQVVGWKGRSTNLVEVILKRGRRTVTLIAQSRE
mmetsp:Transcript_8149/g.24091  ORF Transcript_8149/g.24091 Transcript_8149/m.24091 type:complete len:287 (+) Transcript_8149:257-1117(+)